jgi:phosphatidylglycerophosphate synthase
MIDSKILPLQHKLLSPMSHILVKANVRADQITIAGFLIGLIAVPFIAYQYYLLGLIFILLNRIFDGLDGQVARLTAPSDRGAFLDIALDFAFYALIPLSFAIANPEEHALPAAVLITAFVGTGSSFLAFALLAEKRNLKSLQFKSKGLYYLGGLTEGAETIALFVAFCIWPEHFALLAYCFAFACLTTTLCRWHQGYTLLDNSPQ